MEKILLKTKDANFYKNLYHEELKNSQNLRKELENEKKEAEKYKTKYNELVQGKGKNTIYNHKIAKIKKKHNETISAMREISKTQGHDLNDFFKEFSEFIKQSRKLLDTKKEVKGNKTLKRHLKNDIHSFLLRFENLKKKNASWIRGLNSFSVKEENYDQFLSILKDSEVEKIKSILVGEVKRFSKILKAKDNRLIELDKKIRILEDSLGTLESFSKNEIDHSIDIKQIAAIKIQKTYKGWKQRRRFKILVQTYVKSPHAKILKKRNWAISEIEKTERDYVNDLKTIVNLYIKPLMSKCIREKNLKVLKTLDEVFINVEQILAIHQIFLLNLESRLGEWPQVYIGDCFLHQAPLFVVYAEYFNKYDYAVFTLNHYLKKDASFMKFCKSTQLATKGNLSLQSLIIKPVQRLMKYPLLLRELLKHTDKNHLDYPNLTAASKRMNLIIHGINEKKRKYSKKVITDYLEKKLAMSKIQLDLHWSNFHKESFINLSLNGKKKKLYYCFIYRDYMIIFSLLHMKDYRNRLLHYEELHRSSSRSHLHYVMNVKLHPTYAKILSDPQELVKATHLKRRSFSASSEISMTDLNSLFEGSIHLSYKSNPRNAKCKTQTLSFSVKSSYQKKDTDSLGLFISNTLKEVGEKQRRNQEMGQETQRIFEQFESVFEWRPEEKLSLQASKSLFVLKK